MVLAMSLVETLAAFWLDASFSNFSSSSPTWIWKITSTRSSYCKLYTLPSNKAIVAGTLPDDLTFSSKLNAVLQWKKLEKPSNWNGINLKLCGYGSPWVMTVLSRATTPSPLANASFTRGEICRNLENARFWKPKREYIVIKWGESWSNCNNEWLALSTTIRVIGNRWRLGVRWREEITPKMSLLSSVPFSLSVAIIDGFYLITLYEHGNWCLFTFF